MIYSYSQSVHKKNSGDICVMNRNSEDVTSLATQINALLNNPSTEEELVSEQALDILSKATSLQVRQPNSKFRLDNRRTLIDKSVVDEAMQFVVPESLRDQILYNSYFPPEAGHPC